MTAMTAHTYRTGDGCNLWVRRGAGLAEPCGAADIGPVLMLHSLFFTGQMFDGLRPYLPTSALLYAPDHRGQGRSDGGAANPSIERLAADMIELIEHHIGAPVHLVGSSMGGYVAMHIARLRPDLLKSLTLSCCTAHAERQPERFAALESRIREHGTGDLQDALRDTMFGEAFVASQSPDGLAWREHFGSLPREVADAVHQVFARPGVEASMADLPSPLLLVSGQLDRAKRPADMDYIHQLTPGSRHLVIDQAGHTPPVETPAIFAQALLELWQGYAAHDRAAAPAGADACLPN